jgi:predicted transcriptional regulator
MKLSEVKELLECEIYTCQDKLGMEVWFCISSDMMSDVLANARPGAIMITGLINSQSVRTAEISDAVAIIYVRGKKPDEQTVNLGDELKIPLMTTRHGMFETCFLLHEAGLEGIC